MFHMHKSVILIYDDMTIHGSWNRRAIYMHLDCNVPVTAKGHEESSLHQVQVIVLYVKYNLFIILEG